MFRNNIGDWTVRTDAVPSGEIETRVTYRGRFVRRRVSATVPEAIETHRREATLVERFAVSASEVAA